jgi:hypothetical protein
MARERPIDRALDRLERMLRRDLQASREERREWRRKLKALNEAQRRNEEAVVSFLCIQANPMSSQDSLANGQTNADEKLDAFMNNVKTLINERRKEEP